MDLASLTREETHQLRLTLEDGAGRLLLLLTVSGTTGPDCPTLLSNLDHGLQASAARRRQFGLRNTLKHFSQASIAQPVFKHLAVLCRWAALW